MKARVYALPGSHPVKAAILMLEHKGIEIQRVDLPNVVCRPVLRALGFAGPTVPAVTLGGGRIQTTRALSRTLDQLQPEPPLFPADSDRRAEVARAERWGDEVLQPVSRRVGYATPIRRNSGDLESFFEGPLLGVPPRVAVVAAGPLLAASARVNRATDDAVRADLAALPGILDRVDELIGDGVIGGGQRNAADFQIAASVRLLMCFDDLRAAMEGRPAAGLATAVVPHFPGRVRPCLPADWLAPLRAGN